MILFFVILGVNLIIAQESIDNNITNPITNESNNKTIMPFEQGVNIITIVPKTFDLGEAYYNIRVENKNNYSINNLTAIVTGKGFSTYDIMPIDTILPNDKDYIIVHGNFREKGNISMRIRILDYEFYYNVLVSSSEEIIKEQEKKDMLANLSYDLIRIKTRYSELENLYYQKKDDNYDVSKMNLDSLRNYIRQAESNIILEKTGEARASIRIAEEEYSYQKNKLDAVKEISSIARLKDYAIIFSTIAGAILTFFAISELLKRNSEKIVSKFNNKDRSINHKLKEKNPKRKK